MTCYNNIGLIIYASIKNVFFFLRFLGSENRQKRQLSSVFPTLQVSIYIISAVKKEGLAIVESGAGLTGPPPMGLKETNSLGDSHGLVCLKDKSI